MKSHLEFAGCQKLGYAPCFSRRRCWGCCNCCCVAIEDFRSRSRWLGLGFLYERTCRHRCCSQRRFVHEHPNLSCCNEIYWLAFLGVGSASPTFWSEFCEWPTTTWAPAQFTPKRLVSKLSDPLCLLKLAITPGYWILNFCFLLFFRCLGSFIPKLWI